MFAHFRKPVGKWINEDLKSPRLRAVFARLMPPEAPTLFLLMVLGYLARGWLSRPVGGTARFRDALVGRYRTLGGKALVNTTVEEILIGEGRARGVRLTDGTMLDADVVVSTSSVPETIFRLLAGRFGAPEWSDRMEQWKMFRPIVLASYGVAHPFDDQPSTLLIDAIDPLTVGGPQREHLYLRIYNEDPAFAPPGHTVVQTMVETDYDWWATRGSSYQYEKDVVADRVATCIDRYLPGMKAAVKMIDIATPLTFWRNARTWRGAFEGWLPSSNVFTHVPKTLPGLERFYLAGQWVEPGGGVPMATMSGRHVVEIMCAAMGRPFRPVPASVAQGL
jgi:phytoene dehydrogenase-like protein